jgi:hypothetical protein
MVALSDQCCPFPARGSQGDGLFVSILSSRVVPLLFPPRFGSQVGHRTTGRMRLHFPLPASRQATTLSPSIDPFLPRASYILALLPPRPALDPARPWRQRVGATEEMHRAQPALSLCAPAGLPPHPPDFSLLSLSPASASQVCRTPDYRAPVGFSPTQWEFLPGCQISRLACTQSPATVARPRPLLGPRQTALTVASCPA